MNKVSEDKFINQSSIFFYLLNSHIFSFKMTMVITVVIAVATTTVIWL